tara:strand:- start:1722 stop:2588 length:867 start_codon:yes stop_codon:yes gene_type:complete
MKIGIGTVQFGTNYGISNKFGQVDFDEQKKILKIAKESGINLLDTAIDYGNSEINLGKHGVNDFKVVTKLPTIPKNLENVSKWIYENVLSSINKLGVNHLYGLLMHKSWQCLDYNGKVWSCLNDLKKDGLVKKIGVSIYSPKELENITKYINLDIVQTPFNLIDRRIQDTGWLLSLNKMGVEIHVRSIFLQGLLLMKEENIPKKFNSWKDIWDKWFEWQKKNPSFSPAHCCLSFVNSVKEISNIIIGFNSLEQLEQIISFNNKKNKIEYPNITCVDESLIYPKNWSDL